MAIAIAHQESANSWVWIIISLVLSQPLLVMLLLKLSQQNEFNLWLVHLWLWLVHPFLPRRALKSDIRSALRRRLLNHIPAGRLPFEVLLTYDLILKTPNHILFTPWGSITPELFHCVSSISSPPCCFMKSRLRCPGPNLKAFKGAYGRQGALPLSSVTMIVEVHCPWFTWLC